MDPGPALNLRGISRGPGDPVSTKVRGAGLQICAGEVVLYFCHHRRNYKDFLAQLLHSTQEKPDTNERK